jgi:hypothetical protein
MNAVGGLGFFDSLPDQDLATEPIDIGVAQC